MIKNVIENFDPESNEVDRYILYEITNFKDGDSDSEFWTNYEDYVPEYDFKLFTTDELISKVHQTALDFVTSGSKIFSMSAD